ncbi:MAG: TonB-dependent receptor plug domain-containing protein, partial [Desulfatiglandaceae bacterium]
MKERIGLKKVFLLGICVALVGASFPASGADQQAQDNEATMEEVVVTGTRTQEEVRRVPANVTVINEKDIRDSNAKNVPDLLRTEEGVSVRDYYGNGKTVNVDLRGFGESSSANTLVLVDGRRVNAIDLSGVDWTQIPIDQIERIEIVRGTGSVLYGDNAVGGVINIITKIPTKKTTLNAEAGLGSYGQHKEGVSLSGGRENISGSIYASYNATEGYRENSRFRTRDMGGKIVLDPSDMLSLNISGSYHSDTFGLPGYLTKAEVAQDRRASDSPLDNAKTTDKYVNLGMDLDLGNLGSIMGDVSFRNRDSESDWVSWMWQSETKTRTWAFTPRYTWAGDISGHKNTFIAGTDFYWTDMDIITSNEGINKNSQGFY